MKILFDLLPIVLFFAAFKLADIYVATAVAIVATAVLIGWTWFKTRKVDPMQWVSLGLIVVFGGATGKPVLKTARTARGGCSCIRPPIACKHAT